ncbi:DUF6463 family protein [Arenibaculum sp.]|jgi:hypothetical protein|uniref:DUF6463 family protein n=1 Tax=Arenibaculum sp. TaxID=2865862 RepID=UPI002E165E43|nr:DUF6463 family protein [Arenibaculum sp.]
MYRASCFGLIVLGVLHLLVLGVDAAGYALGWSRGILWTFEHWAPVAQQSRPLVLSGFAFWSSFGSFALPLIGLGYLLLWIDNRGWSAPRAVILGIIGWSLVGTFLMPPSGFPLALLVSLGLWARREPDRRTAAA